MNPRPTFSTRPTIGRRMTSNYRSGSAHAQPQTPRSHNQTSSGGASMPMSEERRSKSGRRSSLPSVQRPLRIMIVEDDAINRSILYKKLTKDYSHEVAQTVHGEDAVRLYNEDPEFDVILMDLQMPICDGYTATKRIREIESHTPQTSTFRHPGSRPIPPRRRLRCRIQSLRRKSEVGGRLSDISQDSYRPQHFRVAAPSAPSRDVRPPRSSCHILRPGHGTQPASSSLK